MRRDLHFEVIYPHPPELVWRALTDPRAFAEWLMANDFEPRVGHRFQFRTNPRWGFDGLVHCEVTELDPPRRLAYSWRGGGMPGPTTVRFELEPVAGGTRLTLDHTGFEGLQSVGISFILGSGWKTNLLRRRLPVLLERLAVEAEATRR